MPLLHDLVSIYLLDLTLANDPTLGAQQLQDPVLIQHNGLRNVEAVLLGEVSREQTLEKVDLAQQLLLLYEFVESFGLLLHPHLLSPHLFLQLVLLVSRQSFRGLPIVDDKSGFHILVILVEGLLYDQLFGLLHEVLRDPFAPQLLFFALLHLQL